MSGTTRPAVLPLDERLETAAQLVIRARISFDVWWFLKGVPTEPYILPIMNQFSEFFRFDREAHFFTFTVTMAALFETRNDTINLGRLMKDLEQTKGANPDQLSAAMENLDAAVAIAAKVTTLRRKLFAHRSGHFSFPSVFQEADVAPDELRSLSDQTLAIVNHLRSSLGLAERYFHPNAVGHLQEMFVALGASFPDEDEVTPDGQTPLSKMFRR